VKAVLEGLSSPGAAPVQAGVVPSDMLSRSQLFAGLFVIGFANGITSPIVARVLGEGLAPTLASTFGISAIVWIASIVATTLVLREPCSPVARTDWIVAATTLGLLLIPAPLLSWLVLTGLAIYVGRTSSSRSSLQRGAWIFLAITIPMFWSQRLFSVLSEFILAMDAGLVGWMTGLKHVGNTVQLADGRGHLFIGMPCSSLANVSLAILCWAVCVQASERQWLPRDLWWCAGACLAVVAVNVGRISLIGLYPEQYELLHGTIGSTVANWVMLALIIGLCLGMRRDLVKNW
jgi:exosortase/archaeosortase family protein